MSTLRHFLDIDQFDGATLRHILDTAAKFKSGNGAAKPLADKTLISIFEKPSTRTRVSFQVGMQQFGGNVVVLSQNDSQLGRGETIADTARVLSRYGDIMTIRTDDPQKLTDLAEYATVPVINALTDDSHPCQIMADIMTFEEHRGSIAGKTVAWVGDGNNMVTSWVHAAVRFGFTLRLACPEELSPSADLLTWAKSEGGNVTLGTSVNAAVDGAHLVTTDTWVSMGDKDADVRNKLLAPYQVNEALMDTAADDALFMHCLPAHRNEEVTDAVLDGPLSVVWDEAENRLHAQKGIIAWCMHVD
ncbi:MAG: ornithine carbamoyltransferase [Rhodospirillaceae bacterium]|jgi:ornithine carbamoyltransferase|nr:ornithine carbamoyltransferase [Rhodospirillales bacterium]MBT4703479.1 ornithine carbamoyltransferase [Rhodospirillaceae bacterium]MBT5033885.1 ornithine carbamoyltransferase [Rhodospirillaceae bacterium]MBT6221135.1 ornithine carbamoyltransferase [Rhodospirillaceae bacterium]MBT6361638.1 ornithine carbamoyltransferase [Rhodospirillaceae bacterium]